MPIPEDYEGLISDLEELTAAKKIGWTSEGRIMFAAVGGALVSVYSGDDPETNEPYVAFNIRKATGRPKLEDEALDHWWVDDGDRDFQRMHDLARAASRKAAGVDELIGTLRKNLQDLKKPTK